MRTHEFSIIASGLDPQAEDFESRFYDAGCDDALISFQRGRIIVDFARDAESIDEAISSAVENVRAAGASVEHIEPDPLVSISEIAARAGLTRAAVSLYAKGQRGQGFPVPVAKVTSESPLWKWSWVSIWLAKSGKLPEDLAIEAAVVQEANNAIALGEMDMTLRLKRRVEEWHIPV